MLSVQFIVGGVIGIMYHDILDIVQLRTLVDLMNCDAERNPQVEERNPNRNYMTVRNKSSDGNLVVHEVCYGNSILTELEC